MEAELKKELCTYLEGFISENRKNRLSTILSLRTSHIRIVLENIYQAHNASAVLRSCDCFGIQHVHFIENKNSLKISDEVAMGSSKWLSVHRHQESENNTTQALKQLKQMGYRIIATTPHEKSTSIENLPLDNKVALVFGTEMQGISDEVRQEADAFVYIPMFGLTESFNISVSAALCMFELSTRGRKTVRNFLMPQEEKEAVYFEWLCNSVEGSETLVRNYLNQKQV